MVLVPAPQCKAWDYCPGMGYRLGHVCQSSSLEVQRVFLCMQVGVPLMLIFTVLFAKTGTEGERKSSEDVQ